MSFEAEESSQGGAGEFKDPSAPGVSPRHTAQARGRARAGLGLGIAVALGLHWGFGLGLWQVLGLAFFYVLLPTLGWAQLPVLKETRIERLPVYFGSGVSILIVGALGLLSGLGLGTDGWERMGLSALPAGEILLWSVGAATLGVGAIALFDPLDRWFPSHGSDLVLELIPRTDGEKVAFCGLSLAAGLGEEVAYRGYALAGAQLLGVGPWAAAALSSVPFAFLHAYQGPVGVARTGTMGFILAVPLLATGSLLPSIAAHAAIDLVAGFVIGPRLLGRRSGA